jgi:hypothetical protein
MKGDFTRFTHDPAKHYSGVLKQQGRVDIDADWNEYVQIRDYIDRTETKDVIGRCGVPNSVPDGFKIVRTEGDSTKLEVMPGRIYVYGILCELAAKKALPNPTGGKDGTYLAYLDVWQRHITAVEDPDLPEIALGGPDTTTRVKTEWQVRFEDVTSQVDAEHLECQPFCCSKGPWAPKGAASTGKLGARAAIAEPTTEICEVPAEAGYRGLQNRLYRVEVHADSAGSKLTFKWSRDNGSVLFPITIDKVEGNSSQGYKSRIILKQPAKDADLSLHVNDWVEVSGEQTELDCVPGTMAQVASESDGTNINKGIIVLRVDLSKYVSQSYVKIRRWDQKEATGVTLVDGAVPVTFDKWVALEDGVEVCFKNGIYQSGDYWMIPARTRTPHVLWDGPGFQDRHGTQHYHCALALIKLAGGVWDLPVDCRHIFPPLTDVNRGGCCITVREGENVQQAIDTVVAAGGGCVCLCHGVHEIAGPLKLHRAHNFSLHGDGPGTILHVHGADNDGISGLWVHACQDVAIDNMVVLADAVPALMSIMTGEESRITRGITLRDLTLFNRTLAGEGKTNNCAIRIGGAQGVVIEDCRLIAETGIVSLFGDKLPELPTPATATKASSRLDYGEGVSDLRMANVSILYRRYGIWSLKSVGWHLRECSITSLPSDLGPAMKPGMESAKKAAHEFKNVYVAVTEAIDAAFAARARLRTGTAIGAFIWQDCTVEDCELAGARGMAVWIWVRGRASGNRIGGVLGLGTAWLHGASWSRNTIECSAGVGLSFGGSYRSSVEGNLVRGGKIGICNMPLGDFTSGFNGYLSEVVKTYGVSQVAADEGDKKRRAATTTHVNPRGLYECITLWVLLEEACRGLGLTALRDSVQALLSTFEAFKNIPVLALAAALLYPRLNALTKRFAKVPLPIVALKADENDVEATESVVLFREFIPMGGLAVTGNRLSTISGQSVLIKAGRVFVHPHVIIFAWRYLFKVLPSYLQRLAAAFAKLDLPKAQREAITGILETLCGLLAEWGKQSEWLLETDYRVEGNNIRSLRTAVESNLFELAVQNNFITLQESQVSADEIAGIMQVLQESKATEGLAWGVRQRSKAKSVKYAQAVKFEGSETEVKEVRRNIGDASYRVSSLTSDGRLKAASQDLNKAVTKGDDAKAKELLDKFGEMLAEQVNTCGVWVKGAGCRIVGNQIIVPMDADPKTWSQGGIRFWDDEGTPIWIVVYLQRLLEIYKPDMEFPSLLSATETLIDNNEIIRGVGHGVEIRGIENMPTGMGLTDLKIRGNQIRDMIGTGIIFGEDSLAVGVDIEGNHIVDCGSKSPLDILFDHQGGLVIRNAAFCRVHDNRISCNSSLTNELALFAVDIRTVYGLDLTDNCIQHRDTSTWALEDVESAKRLYSSMTAVTAVILASMCGCVRMAEMYGDVGVINNDLALVQGLGSGLLLGEITTNDKVDSWGKKVAAKAQAVRMQGRKAAAPATTTAVVVVQPIVATSAIVQGNRFQPLLGQPFLAFLLGGFRDLNFSGNNVRTLAETTAPGVIQSALRAVISNNLLDTLWVQQLAAGVIVGNTSNRVINVPSPLPSTVTQGLNIPPIP